MTTRSLPFLLGLAVLGVGGCGDAKDPRPAEWHYISAAIIEPNCATSSCHSSAAAVAGLDFSTPDDGYRSLYRLNVKVGEDKYKRALIAPGFPESSRIIHMMRGTEALVMPPDRRLAEADVELIEQWILEGAQRN